MICSITSYPMTCDPADVVANQKQMQIMNWFCSDMHVRGEYPYYMKRFFAEHNITIHQEPEDAAILKAGTVDFYTFSYYMSNCVTTHKDAEDVGGNIATGKNEPLPESQRLGLADRPHWPALHPERDLRSLSSAHDGSGKRPGRLRCEERGRQDPRQLPHRLPAGSHRADGPRL